MPSAITIRLLLDEMDRLGREAEAENALLAERTLQGAISPAPRTDPAAGQDGRPLFLVDYPASQAALARVREEPDGTRVGERFELYIDGVELANGYHELGDPAEQRRRLEEANAARVASGRPPLPIAESLVAALEAGLPPCAGVALGFDRLVMVATGHDTIDAVRAFPPE